MNIHLRAHTLLFSTSFQYIPLHYASEYPFHFIIITYSHMHIHVYIGRGIDRERERESPRLTSTTSNSGVFFFSPSPLYPSTLTPPLTHNPSRRSPIDSATTLNRKIKYKPKEKKREKKVHISPGHVMKIPIAHDLLSERPAVVKLTPSSQADEAIISYLPIFAAIRTEDLGRIFSGFEPSRLTGGCRRKVRKFTGNINNLRRLENRG